MSRVVIAGRTHMHNGHICVGAHDLDRRFRSLRLLDRFGGHWLPDCPFRVGDVWSIRYVDKASARKPHVEDVCVMEERRLQPVDDLKGLVLRNVSPWVGNPLALYGRTVCSTRSGSVYVPERGPLPGCSTGYWQPAHELVLVSVHDKTRFEYAEGTDRWRIKWVGTQEPPHRIDEGALARVSLSRLFGRDDIPSGYYVQISGIL